MMNFWRKQFEPFKKCFSCLIFLCLTFVIVSCTRQPTPQPTLENTAIPVQPTQLSNIVTISGWFTTVWNGEPHYSITDDQGQTTHLLLDPELTVPLGGALELDRKRVTLSGEIMHDPQGTLRVLSIRFEDGQ